ncbi:sporulation related protein [Solitalea canadensis DSM 3403]|uniref:Sporulation related protein n=1 Tax=Solitalea canadensis (strain ATCC 29591 / DSM 3403 / JCM 21819 / LMG 8368 / NBRC 15130 / NCIMB 12057 / USAM 9D) TaxID=929556 RepID=H8KN08_SOLCM|nr:sporulation related protein [Solitalea canadensis DSM 3403]
MLTGKRIFIVLSLLLAVPVLVCAQQKPTKPVTKPSTTTNKPGQKPATTPAKQNAPAKPTTVPAVKPEKSPVEAPKKPLIDDNSGFENTSIVRDSILLSNVEVVAQPGINELLAKRIEINRKPPAFGFRLQIYSGPNRNEAYSLQIKFALKYPELGSYLSYQVPNYKLRVGDFATRTDAERVKKLLDKDFDVAFIVSDKLNQQKVYQEGETELPQ